jgi:hypothetical protein
MPVKLWLVFIGAVLLPGFCDAQAHSAKGRILSGNDTDKVEIDLRATYHAHPLKLGDQYYVNALNDTFYIDAFRIYLTNIGFSGDSEAHCINSHLFDAEDSSSYSFVIAHVPPGVYSALRFTAGVDSMANTSGANDGDLDPVKGMYWAWNSGYIMAKLEGHSKVCKTLHNAFEFHIGGYMPPCNAARTVSLKMPEQFRVGRLSLPAVSLNVDVARWLENIDLATVNSILTPGKDAAMMADLYAQIFSIERIFFTPLIPR